MSNTRNRSLIDVPAMAKKIEQRHEPGPGPRTSDEEYAHQMARAVPRVANLLGVCHVCFEDLQIVDGRWLCFGCRQEPPLDVVAEDLTGSKIGFD